MQAFFISVLIAVGQFAQAQVFDWLPKPAKDTVVKHQSTGWPTTLQVIKDAAFGTTMWSLSIQHENSGHPALTHEQLNSALNTFNEYYPNSEYQAALLYRNEMKDAFKFFTIYCDNIAAFLPNPSKRPIPFRFADKDGKKCVILTDMASPTMYNTIRTTSRSRAAKVLTSCLIPNVSYLYEAFEKSDIAFLGLTIVFGSKDFSVKSDVMNLKPEMLAFVCPREKCKQFIEGIITESEFIDASDVYITDRDMSSLDFKKVKLQIE